MARSNAWAELVYRSLAPPWDDAIELFRFAGAWSPARERIEWAWGALDHERLCAALVIERAGTHGMLHGPVVVAPPEAPPEAALDVATELLLTALGHAPAHGVDTIVTRPQGLDRLWVRRGFIPIPEAELPAALRGRPGQGLFGWRGGTALWSAAGRGAPRVSSLNSR